MDSPRGLWWDGKKTLYVLHPPNITAYTDEDGDGKADTSKDVVTGLGFDLKFRGADHTTNGFRIGIDGFFYVAVGDYGAVQAGGKSKPIQLRGGGVVRVRPDGTGLEIVSRGQRNIYDVAVSPTLDLFTRDNTNDGDGWDVRLSHVVPTANYGYPSLYTNFPNDLLAPLADYGGGSPTGALFLDEPGYPPGLGTALYTCEWGRSHVYRHPLTPNGASWKAGQEKFLDIPRPTDIDVDGLGRLYVSSWKDGSFNYSGPNVGFVARLVPTGHKPAAFPDLAKASAAELVKFIGSPSATLRLYAQREILRRGVKPVFTEGLEKLAAGDNPLSARVAAIFTLNQLLGAKAHEFLVKLLATDAVREFALKALADNVPVSSTRSESLVLPSLKDPNPRVRVQAILYLRRTGAVHQAEAECGSSLPFHGECLHQMVEGLLPLTSDNDPVISHLAVNTLAALGPNYYCLKAVDGPFSTGALRALRQVHRREVVDELVTHLQNPKKNLAQKRALLIALARLYNMEAPWDGKWWGTRPDHVGPYFKPVTWEASPKIAEVFRAELAAADGEAARWLIPELVRNRVYLPEVAAATLKFAKSDPLFRPIAVTIFAGKPSPPEETLPLFAEVAVSAKEPADLRAKAVRALMSFNKPEARAAVLKALTAETKLPGPLEKLWADFARDGKHVSDVSTFVKLARDGSEAEKELAFGVLGSMTERTFGTKEARAAAEAAVQQGLGETATIPAVLAAIQRLNLGGYAPQVRRLADSKDAALAKRAKATLGKLKVDAAVSPPGQPSIGKMAYADVLALAVKEKGKAGVGEKLFLRVGCINCHTVSPDEPQKGPMLAGIAARYKREELAESVLKPSNKIAQGFETYTFQMADGTAVTGFIARESGTEVEVRDSAGAVRILKKDDIDERRPGKVSVMPDQLVDHLTPQELAAILAYLESLKGK